MKGAGTIAANQLVQTRIDGAIKAKHPRSCPRWASACPMRLMLIRVAREKTLPFEPLIPNETTIAAMRAARAGAVESVTLDDLRAIPENA